jgi:hypothetical protein
MKSFAQLFGGRADCFGTYHVLEIKDGKHKGKGTTYPNTRFPDRVLEPDDWRKHLSGDQMLGIVPVLLDGTCSWFALDVDDYSVSHHKLVVDIETNELPLIVCRSKSGGAHLYCFTEEPIDAKLAVDLLKKWAEILNLTKIEIFPKQVKFDNPEAKGNWIIVPYYGGDKANDFAISLDGKKLDVADFVTWANAKIITVKEAKAFTKKKIKSIAEMGAEEILKESPPCVVTLFDKGISSGGRNNVAAHLCVYFQKLDAALDTSDWVDKVSEANQKYMDEPLAFSELNQIIKNYSNVGHYQYSCDAQPMCNICDKPACLKKKLGVGEDKSFYGELIIQSMIKIDTKPSIWIPKINGIDVEMDTDTLLNPRKFRIAIAEALNMLVEPIRQGMHDKLIGPIMKSALTIEPMEELTNEGKVNMCFQEWTKNMITKSRQLQDLLKGLPYFNQDEGTIYFRGTDFIKEYRRIYKDNTTERQIWTSLRKMGFGRKQHRIEKEPAWIWYYNMGDEELWFDIDTGDQF